MFGHQDDHHDDNQQPQADGVLEHGDNLHPHDEGHINPAVPRDVDNFGAPSDDTPDDGADDTVTPAVSGGQPVPAHDDMGSPPADDVITSSPNDDLLDIKTQALQQLTPLVGHLDQSPEEKFRTTMMMIQASDNQDLVKVAYEAAREITDEKAKAQALLDIVNEINYFTHHGNGEA
jgi:hypothetical protein